MAADKYRLEFLAPGKQCEVIELFSKCFKGTLSDEFWKWRFLDNPDGRGIIALAYSEGEAVSHYAVSPVRLRSGEESVYSGLSGTTMTHPGHRGQRLFQRLAGLVYEKLSKDGFSLVWGFPNSQIHRTRARDLSWVDIHEVPVFHAPVSAVQSASDSGIVELADLSAIPSGNLVSDRWIHSDRSLRKLKWRYQEQPGIPYRVFGVLGSDREVCAYLVAKRYKNQIQVVDLFPPDDGDTAVALVAKAVQSYKGEDGIESVGMWLNPGTAAHHALEKIGFAPGAPVTYFGGLMLAGQPSLRARLLDFRQWHYTMGDSDNF